MASSTVPTSFFRYEAPFLLLLYLLSSVLSVERNGFAVMEDKGISYDEWQRCGNGNFDVSLFEQLRCDAAGLRIKDFSVRKRRSGSDSALRPAFHDGQTLVHALCASQYEGLCMEPQKYVGRFLVPPADKGGVCPAESQHEPFQKGTLNR